MAGSIKRISKVVRLGNSLGVRIPRDVAEQLKLEERQAIRVQVKGDTITIRRANARKKWTEAELLRGVTPEICGMELVPDRRGKELL